MWALVDFERLLVSVDPATLALEEMHGGIAVGGSDVSPGMAVGANAIWITAPGAITCVPLTG